jgi:hypothetical protein
MKVNILQSAMLLLSILSLSTTSYAQETTGQTLAEKMKQGNITIEASVRGCGEDVKQHCPGLGNNSQRVFMCLGAYEAYLTPQCKQGILEASLSIKTSAAAIDYSISACEADADKHCLEVQPGEGRLLRCLKANQTNVSNQCVTALRETGLWESVQ